MSSFHDWMLARQIEWRQGNVSTPAHGVQNKRKYPHVIPKAIWEETLWPQLRTGREYDLPSYLGSDVQHHTGVHNLLSSWVACANFYFPFRKDEDGRQLLAGFLRSAVDPQIERVTGLELEWAADGDLAPKTLLGESDGKRGSGQTSPDVAFLVEAKVKGRRQNGIVLVESKLTEKSFYPCSARSKRGRSGRSANPDPSRCSNPIAVARCPSEVCHQVEWGRKYWKHLRPLAEKFSTLKRCPAATAGYQLLRQQALSNGLRSATFPFVASCVAYDARNEQLLRCMKGTGLAELGAFATLFQDAVPLRLFTHQAWWHHVRTNGGKQWSPWVRWIEKRYLFA